jgi:hypothetical protein
MEGQDTLGDELSGSFVSEISPSTTALNVTIIVVIGLRMQNSDSFMACP